VIKEELEEPMEEPMGEPMGEPIDKVDDVVVRCRILHCGRPGNNHR
jgi:hypothetical protein